VLFYKDMNRLIFIIISNLFLVSLFGQDDETIVDPIFYHCYRLQDTSRIEPIKLEGHYFGKAIIQAKVDTINDKLKDYVIVYAKLSSSMNPRDSILIRYKNKYGKYAFLENQLDKIVPYISEKKIVRTNIENCVVPIFSFAIKIIEK
jgi:hypothetical protein